MSFNESNIVEQMILDAFSSLCRKSPGALVLLENPLGWGGSLGGAP